MEPLVVKTRLSLDQYCKMNFYILWNRLRWLLVWVAILLLICSFSTSPKELADSSSLWIVAFLLLYLMILPLINYFAARHNYKNIKSMSEYKVYQFDDYGVQMDGQTINMKLAWSNVLNVSERKSSFLVSMCSKRSIAFLPKSDFSVIEDIDAFKNLVVSKGVKSKFIK